MDHNSHHKDHNSYCTGHNSHHMDHNSHHTHHNSHHMHHNSHHTDNNSHHMDHNLHHKHHYLHHADHNSHLLGLEGALTLSSGGLFVPEIGSHSEGAQGAGALHLVGDLSAHTPFAQRLFNIHSAVTQHTLIQSSHLQVVAFVQHSY